MLSLSLPGTLSSRVSEFHGSLLLPSIFLDQAHVLFGIGANGHNRITIINLDHFTMQWWFY